MSVFWAEWRRGLKDLQNAVLNPWNGVTQTHEESGTIANPTQQLVTDEIRGRSFDEMVQQYAAKDKQSKNLPEQAKGQEQTVQKKPQERER